MKPSKAMMRAVHRENREYPEALIEMTPSEILEVRFQSGSRPVRVWRSRRFLVTLWLEPNGYRRLSVRRTEFNFSTGEALDGISWDDLQRLKSEAGFGHVCAVEVYPPDARVVNVAPMRHLFLLDEVPPYVWGDPAT